MYSNTLLNTPDWHQLFSQLEHNHFLLAILGNAVVNSALLRCLSSFWRIIKWLNRSRSSIEVPPQGFFDVWRRSYVLHLTGACSTLFLRNHSFCQFGMVTCSEYNNKWSFLWHKWQLKIQAVVNSVYFLFCSQLMNWSKLTQNLKVKLFKLLNALQSEITTYHHRYLVGQLNFKLSDWIFPFGSATWESWFFSYRLVHLYERTGYLLTQLLIFWTDGGPAESPHIVCANTTVIYTCRALIRLYLLLYGMLCWKENVM